MTQKPIENLLIESSLEAGRCQRNWDVTIDIPKIHLDTLVDVAMNMPTKQNVLAYELIVLTKRKDIEQLFSLAIATKRDNPTGHEFTGSDMFRNNQINASLLFIWIRTNRMEQNENYYYNEKIDSNDYKDLSNTMADVQVNAIGISSGATALAANMLGYKTGFNNCFLKEETNKWISDNITDTNKTLVNSLGIGKPLENYKRNQVVIDDEIKFISDIKEPFKERHVHII